VTLTRTIRRGNCTWKNGWPGSSAILLQARAGSSTSGKDKRGSARSVVNRYRLTNDRGTSTIGCGAVTVGNRRWTTWRCCTSTATERPTQERVTEGPSRVWGGGWGRLERYEAEVSRTVLRGGGWRKPLLLPDRRRSLGWRRCSATRRISPSRRAS